MRYLGELKPDLNDLVHFGVKGMRWGVRKDDPYAATQSKEERKAAKENYKNFSAQVFEKKYADGFFDRTISKEQYDKLSTKDVVVRKGKLVRRVSKLADDKLGDDQTYVSYTKKDQGVYRAVLPPIGSAFKLGGNKTYKPAYEATYKSLETLKSPSEKARVDAFIDLMDSREIRLRKNKVISGREYMKRNGYRKEARTLDRQQLGLKFYKEFLETQGAQNHPMNSAYVKKLRDKGYNAIVDDNDRGHLAESPLIILNPNGTLKKMGVKRLTADEVNKAQRDLELDEKD